MASAGLVPGGWIWQRLQNVARNPRRWRWNRFLRACKAIPAGSPVAGSTSWKRINARRIELIDRRVRRDNREFLALQEVASAVVSPGRIAQHFIIGRNFRRLERKGLV